MKRFSIPLGLTLAALTLLAAGAPAHAGERPIRAEGQGYLDNASGYMFAFGYEDTHLGKADFYGYLDPYAIDNSQILHIPVVLLAPNGDWLYLDSVVDYDVVTGIAIGTLTFAGGTGRFQDATGSADVMFDFGLDYPHQVFRFEIDGSIDY